MESCHLQFCHLQLGKSLLGSLSSQFHHCLEQNSEQNSEKNVHDTEIMLCENNTYFWFFKAAGGPKITGFVRLDSHQRNVILCLVF